MEGDDEARRQIQTVLMRMSDGKSSPRACVCACVFVYAYVCVCVHVRVCVRSNLPISFCLFVAPEISAFSPQCISEQQAAFTNVG